MASLSAKAQDNMSRYISTRTYFREYVVLKFVFAHTYLQTSAEVCTNYG